MVYTIVLLETYGSPMIYLISISTGSVHHLNFAMCIASFKLCNVKCAATKTISQLTEYPVIL